MQIEINNCHFAASAQPRRQIADQMGRERGRAATAGCTNHRDQRRQRGVGIGLGLQLGQGIGGHFEQFFKLERHGDHIGHPFANQRPDQTDRGIAQCGDLGQLRIAAAQRMQPVDRLRQIGINLDHQHLGRRDQIVGHSSITGARIGRQPRQPPARFVASQYGKAFRPGNYQHVGASAHVEILVGEHLESFSTHCFLA